MVEKTSIKRCKKLKLGGGGGQSQGAAEHLGGGGRGGWQRWHLHGVPWMGGGARDGDGEVRQAARSLSMQVLCSPVWLGGFPPAMKKVRWLG